MHVLGLPFFARKRSYPPCWTLQAGGLVSNISSIHTQSLARSKQADISNYQGLGTPQGLGRGGWTRSALGSGCQQDAWLHL